jgi:hypothetical protein
MARMASVPKGLLAKFKIESLEYLLIPNSNKPNTLGFLKPLFDKLRDSILKVGRFCGCVGGIISLCFELIILFILSSLVTKAKVLNS